MEYTIHKYIFINILVTVNCCVSVSLERVPYMYAESGSTSAELPCCAATVTHNAQTSRGRLPRPAALQVAAAAREVAPERRRR